MTFMGVPFILPFIMNECDDTIQPIRNVPILRTNENSSFIPYHQKKNKIENINKQIKSAYMANFFQTPQSIYWILVYEFHKNKFCQLILFTLMESCFHSFHLSFHVVNFTYALFWPFGQSYSYQTLWTYDI